MVEYFECETFDHSATKVVPKYLAGCLTHHWSKVPRENNCTTVESLAFGTFDHGVTDFIVIFVAFCLQFLVPVLYKHPFLSRLTKKIEWGKIWR